MQTIQTTVKLNIEDLQEEVLEKLADKVVDHIWDLPDHVKVNLDWGEEQKALYKHRERFLKKINWSKAAPELSEIIIKKYFEKLMER